MSKPSVHDTRIIANRDLHNDYHSLTLGPFPQVAACAPGSFIHLRLPESDILFRRAMSVAAVDPVRATFEIIYKVFGREQLDWPDCGPVTTWIFWARSGSASVNQRNTSG